MRHGPNEPQAGADALRRLLELDEPPTAVVASSDVLAIGVLHAAHVLGVAVPDQLSVTGFDDVPLADFSVPSLTTVQMPVRAMVQRALNMVLDDAEPGPRPQAILQPSLVVRSSTSPAKAPTIAS
jgi:DNA-binding LacI/PurR family transcriptional regulator